MHGLSFPSQYYKKRVYLRECNLAMDHFSLRSALVSLLERGANKRGCSCRPIFDKKRVLVEKGMHVGKFSIEKGCK